MPKAQLKSLCILLVISITPTWAEDKEAVKKDLAALQGEWSMVSGTADGQVIPEAMRKQMKRVCKDQQVTATMGPQLIFKAKITLDPAKDPRAIDFHMIQGPNAGKTQLGIYKLEGDTFTSCFSAPGDDRPADFVSKDGDHRTLTEWKRKDNDGGEKAKQD